MNNWPKVHLLARKGFFYLVFNYSYVLAGLQMKLQLLPPSFPPPDAHQERAAWARESRERPGLALCAGMLLDIQDGEREVSTFGIPNSFRGSHPSPSPTAFAPLLHQPPPKPFFPSSPRGSLPAIPGRMLTNAVGPLFLGGSGGEQHTGPGGAGEGTWSIVWI